MAKRTEFSELLGHSILSNQLVEFLELTNLVELGDPFTDYQNNILWIYKEDNDQGISITLNGYKRYLPEFGKPKSLMNEDTDELILGEITFDDKFINSEISKYYKLPFDLDFGDSKEVIIEKICKKPYEKSKSITYAYAWWFQFDEFRLLTALDDNFKLIWFRICKLAIDEKEKIELNKSLNSQNKNINPDNETLILSYLKNIPTIDWKKRKKEIDNVFTENLIIDVEKLLNDYVIKIIDLTKKKKASPIYNSIKKIVISLNKINKKHNNFIETMEREELCEFINTLVRKTGFEIGANIDLTEQWREW